MVAFFLSILFAITDFFGMADDKKKIRERTFLMIKPDAVQRGLVGEIIQRFEKRGYALVAMKMKQATKAHLEEHYAEHKDKKFFRGLVDYMASGPVVAMVWEGDDVVAQSRKMLGETHPRNSAPGTIRGDFAIDLGRNIMHGSDSVDNAKQEIDLWFPSDKDTKSKEIVDWVPSVAEWLYE